MSTSVPKYKLGVIGCGFMAQAVLFGAIERGFLMPEEIIVSDPDEEKRQAFSRKGMQTADDNRTVAQNCRFLFFAVKPQSFDAVADDLNGVEVPVCLLYTSPSPRD
jgi:pyrroline-5-carboxylate reductase